MDIDKSSEWPHRDWLVYWELYAHAVRRFGPKPTLIEWGNDLPDFGTLTEEARRADRVAAAALGSVRDADAV